MAAAKLPATRHDHGRRRRHTVRRSTIAAVTAIAGLLLAACASDPDPEPERVLSFDGPEEQALFNADTVGEVVVSVTGVFEGGGEVVEGPPPLDDLVILLDGEDVTAEAAVDGGTLRFAPRNLDDGERTVVILSQPAPEEEGAPAPEPEELQRFTFEVDTTPPELELTGPESPLIAGDAVVFTGTTEPGATVRIGTAETTADGNGSFSLELPAAPEGEVSLLATDRAGNSTTDEAAFVVVPSRVVLGEYRAVHLSMCGWNSSLRDNAMQLLDAGVINAVQLDLKNEAGEIFNDLDLDIAQRSGSGQHSCRYDLEAAIAELHGMGVPVIGRMVAFADPIVAGWAWEAGERDLTINVTDGSDLFRGSYAGFTNYTHPDIIAYNVGVAEAAAAMGIDHILWDYIRRPEGINNYVVPGLETTPEEAIADFTRQADEALAPYGILHGASVFGIAADRPTQIGQDITLMGHHLDYVSPMIYPSHWGPGEYGISDPNRDPYAIITATMEVWEEVTADLRARVIPWIEDTAYRAWDRPFQVREQLRALNDGGTVEWLMWDSRNNYSGLREGLGG